jgi:uncharacterized protein YrrD
MLRSIKQLYGDSLRAADGEIGHIKDFYFDDRSWVIRYVVADTGTWLSGRLVLLSPHVFSNFDIDGVCRTVNLTRHRIESSPSFDTHKPISRQYEEEYYQYYGWPYYWQGDGLWGGSGFPTMEPSAEDRPDEPFGGGASLPQSADAHLRSTQALAGYHIQTKDGEIGHVIDFIVDHKTWAICHLVVETGHWFSGKEIVVSPKHIDRISYEESKVFVNVTKEAIQAAPEYHVRPWAFQDSEAVANSL